MYDILAASRREGCPFRVGPCLFADIGKMGIFFSGSWRNHLFVFASPEKKKNDDEVPLLKSDHGSDRVRALSFLNQRRTEIRDDTSVSIIITDIPTKGSQRACDGPFTSRPELPGVRVLSHPNTFVQHYVWSWTERVDEALKGRATDEPFGCVGWIQKVIKSGNARAAIISL